MGTPAKRILVVDDEPSIVDAHGGSVAAESEPGHGVRFRIELPRA